MKKILVGVMFFFLTGMVWAQGVEPTATEASPTESVSTPVPQVLKKWAVAAVPWDGWFKKNALVTDKTEYVHFFWNAQDFKGNFEVKDKKVRLAEAALELVKRLYPKDATADLMKVDIVYVLERDDYGMPKWDSLQRVAHLEFSKVSALKLTKKKAALSEALMKKIFTQFDLF
jgi:hypothetical protein